MRCDKCHRDFIEREVHESHDVPCYLFKGQYRNERKNQADKFGRHWLCKKCHEEYEDALREVLIKEAIKFSKEYFK
jgi:hypothetical protein